MAAFHGQRFHVNLESDDEDGDAQDGVAPRSPLGMAPGFIKDIQERPSSAATDAVHSPPVAKPAPSGFPAHRKRNPVSKFKQKQAAAAVLPDPLKAGTQSSISAVNDPASAAQDNFSFDTMERQKIDQENKQRLSQMSDESIARERQELMEALSPSLIQRLLQRANIDDPSSETHFPSPSDSEASEIPKPRIKVTPNDLDNPNTSVAPSRTPAEPSESNPASADAIPDIPQPREFPLTNIDDIPPPSLHAAMNPLPPPPLPTTTAALPYTPLDPSSPTFLTTLHEKYYPTLPADPSKLAWMAPTTDPEDPSTSPDSDTYSPDDASLPPSALRFNFSGALLAPRTSHTLPPTLGLHHHSAAPAAAGYTLPELAHLARSTVPAQRCIAFRTLGRALFRLGSGGFGPQGSDLVEGLWACVARGRVLETLSAAAAEGPAGGGHVSARAYAVEALWLWKRGGGRMRFAGEVGAV